MAQSDLLIQITSLAQLMVAKEEEVKAAELVLTRLKAEVRTIATEDIPSLMSEAGLTSFELADGHRVEVDDAVTFAITEENRDPCYAWLEEHGFGGLIKTLVSVAFGREELEKALKLVKLLQEADYTPSLKRDVHWQTMNAFLREQLREAKPLPMELFGANPYKLAKLKAPKKSKGK